MLDIYIIVLCSVGLRFFWERFIDFLSMRNYALTIGR